MTKDDESSVKDLLRQAASTEGHKCHICDSTAHYRIELGERGHWACVEHVQLVIEAVVQWATGNKLVIDPARWHEQQAKKASKSVKES